MEITLDRLKSIIGDKECQIVILTAEKNKLIEAYNKLNEHNKQLRDAIVKQDEEKVKDTD